MPGRITTSGNIRKGRIDTKDAANPDRRTPDSLGLSSGLKNFEQVSPEAVHGTANSGTGTMHGGHAVGDGSSPSFAAQAASRGITEHAQALSAARGHAPKRGPGEKTGSVSSQAELQEKGLTR